MLLFPPIWMPMTVWLSASPYCINLQSSAERPLFEKSTWANVRLFLNMLPSSLPTDKVAPGGPPLITDWLRPYSLFSLLVIEYDPKALKEQSRIWMPSFPEIPWAKVIAPFDVKWFHLKNKTDSCLLVNKRWDISFVHRSVNLFWIYQLRKLFFLP
jgi:hypothetical protein